MRKLLNFIDMKSKIIGIIPARMKSSRFPGTLHSSIDLDRFSDFDFNKWTILRGNELRRIVLSETRRLNTS